MYFCADFPIVGGKIYFSGDKVVLPKSFTEIRLDSNLDAVMKARFPSCNALTLEATRLMISKLNEKNFSAIAVSNDGMFVLAAKNSDGEWVESGALNNNGELMRVDDEQGVVYSEKLSLAPARDEDKNSLAFLHELAGVRAPQKFQGTHGIFSSTIDLMGIPVTLSEVERLPEEQRILDEEHSKKVEECKQLIINHLDETSSQLEDAIIWDCDYLDSGHRTNIKLHSTAFCENLSNTFSYGVLEEALEDLN